MNAEIYFGGFYATWKDRERGNIMYCNVAVWKLQSYAKKYQDENPAQRVLLLGVQIIVAV